LAKGDGEEVLRRRRRGFVALGMFDEGLHEGVQTRWLWLTDLDAVAAAALGRREEGFHSWEDEVILALTSGTVFVRFLSA
jgi:hypothetical protein